ncbi:hypothetical protein C8J56DRAFT_1058513 [Mycena floridula]|nr:hypothetical protein C8J56DRAFT_1058513 [Mycena floridula]
MKTTQILAGQLFDSYLLRFLPEQVITISNGRIVDVRPLDDASLAPDALDLRHLTVLPGFVDVHVHMFLHAYNETSWDDQLTKESLAERTIRATVHARATLMAGFTTVRDLGTEGAEDADIALRKCISSPNALIPGPRLFIANRAIVSTGSYGPKSSIQPHTEGIQGVTGAEVVDGITECVKAVRRQIGAGADWIKASRLPCISPSNISSDLRCQDYRTRSRMQQVNPQVAGKAISTFNRIELEAMISTAHASGVKVAVHAHGAEAIRNSLELGVDSIEHGGEVHLVLDTFVKSPGTIWVPTLAVVHKLAGTTAPWEEAAKSFKLALEAGMENIACGTDAGAFRHSENALEMKLMVRLGADWRKVLRWATLGGWECIRPLDWEQYLNVPPNQLGDNCVPFGALRPGFSADIIAVEGDLEKDFEGTVDRVQFVMKAGKVFKQHGREVV